MRRRLRRAGWVFLGAVLGLLVAGIGLLLYLRLGQVAEVRTEIGERLQLPPEAFEVERVTATGRARIALRNVVIHGEAGDTLVAAPRATMWFDATSLAGDGPIEFWSVELRQPFARLVQAPDGSWNIQQAMRVTADGRDVAVGEEGREIRFRDVRLVGGRVQLAVPAERPEEGTFAARLRLPFTRVGAVDYQTYSFTDLNARLPLVRVGGAAGWRVEVGSLAANLREPRMRIAQVQGWAQAEGADGVRFSLAALRVGESRLAGGGLIRFADGGPLYDVNLRAEPLRLADLQPLLPDTPLEGQARFDLDLVTEETGRATFAFGALELDAFDSRASGTLRLAVGGGQPLAFGPTNLSVDALELLTLERLGLVDELPVIGSVSGTISTAEFTPDVQQGRLQVNLAASLVPRSDPGQAPSMLVAVGPVSFGGADRPMVFEDLRIQLQPLRLATLAALAPAQAELLRGEARGVVRLSGTTRDLRLAGGELLYQVGDAEPTRLADISGALALDPLVYDIRARAEPLALATLTELFPALPFRAATLSGPLRIRGDATATDFDANLTGPTGGIRFAGSARFGDPLSFDLRGELAAFTASRLLRAEVPLEGPVSGTFAARGTADDVRFEVDLRQALGRFALEGRVQPGVEPALFDVSGRVTDFRIGALLGDPALFPAPVTGDIAISGGGTQPYRYDVDLRGAGSVFDLAGTFRPGAVPAYTARGRVLGLNLSRLPVDLPLPNTVLNASIALDARGTSLETLAGTLWIDATGSNVGGVLVDQAHASLAVRDGVLEVDTLGVAMRGNRITAAGRWGLTRAVTDPLRFSINAPDLAALSQVVPTTQLVPPRMSGSLTAEGWVAGSFRYPAFAVNLRGRRLQLEEYRAGTLALEASADRRPGIGWGGRASASAENLLVANERFQSMRLEAAGTESALAVGLYARQDQNRDLALSGMLELEGLTPRAIALETLNLRLAEATWRLVQPARVQWADVTGLEVRNLALQRTGDVGGWLQVDGRLPPTGAADLRVNARDVDLADARRIWPGAPDLQGRMTLDAVLQGPASDPELTISGRVDGLRVQGAAADVVILNADYLDGQIQGRADVLAEGRQIATAEGTIPLLLRFENYIPRFEPRMTAPLTAQVYADALPLQLVAALVPGLENGDGTASARVEVSGTLETPSFSGFTRVRGGALDVTPLGIRLTEIDASLALEENTIRIDTLLARSGGYISAGGLVIFAPGSPPRLNLSAELNSFRAVDTREVGRVITSGRIALAGPVTQPVLTGRLQLEDTQLNVPEMGEAEALEIADVDVGQMGPDPLADLDPGPVFLTDLRIDGLDVVAGDAVWLVSDDMRVQIVGEIVVYRTGPELRVFGGLQTVRGRYTLAIGTINREFEVVSGNVEFMGTPDINPAIDIVAANRVRTGSSAPGGDLTVLVHVTGTMMNPQIALTSDTPVPISESELLSYLIFGRPSFELGGETGQLAQQILVQEVLGGLVATGLERPFLEAGICDYVRVRPGLTTFGGLQADPLNTFTTAAIECGRQLTDGVFLTVETGIGGLFGGEATLDWGAGLEWQLSDEWQWEIQYGPVRRGYFPLFDQSPEYQFSTDIRRRWEYGGTRRRSLLEAIPERTIFPGDVMPVEDRPASPPPPPPEEPEPEPVPVPEPPPGPG